MFKHAAALASVLGIGGLLSYGLIIYTNPKPSKIFFGQQFSEKDLSGTTGKLMKLAVACDMTAQIVPDLLNDGFVPKETSTTSDVDGNVYVLTFWERVGMRIVTETDTKNMTCIISVSNNVKSLQSPDGAVQNDGKSSDNLDGIVPL